MKLPLEGLRVLTLEQYGAGPYCSMFLADMGADVIKIENPSSGGDFSRSTGPYFLGENDSQYFQAFNLNKKSITLDIKSTEGRKILEKLVKDSDAIINNMRGNQPSKLKVDYGSLKSINPKIVCGHISAYGRDNLRADWPGYDYLMQAESGFLSVTGEPDGPPARFGLSLVDFMTGMMLAFGVSASIIKAKSSNIGGDVDVSLMEAALHQLTYPGVWYLNEGLITGRAPRGAHPSVTPSQLVKAEDGWVFIMCQNPRFWSLLLVGLEREDLAEDTRFKGLSDRLENREILTKVLDNIFAKKTVDEWLEIFKGKIPIAPVFDMAQALDSNFVQDIGMITEVDHPDRADFRVLNNPIKLDGKRVPIKAAPKLGADNGDLLGSLGYTKEEIMALKKSGVI